MSDVALQQHIEPSVTLPLISPSTLGPATPSFPHSLHYPPSVTSPSHHHPHRPRSPHTPASITSSHPPSLEIAYRRVSEIDGVGRHGRKDRQREQTTNLYGRGHRSGEERKRLRYAACEVHNVQVKRSPTNHDIFSNDTHITLSPT